MILSGVVPISHSGRKGTSSEPQNQGHDHLCHTFDIITTLLSCTISTWFCSSRWETTDNQLTSPAMLMCECVFLLFRLLYILHWRACVTFHHEAKYSNLPQFTYLLKWIVSLKTTTAGHLLIRYHNNQLKNKDLYIKWLFIREFDQFASPH